MVSPLYRRYNFNLNTEQADRFEYMIFKEKVTQKELFVKMINEYYSEKHDPEKDKKIKEKYNINKIRLNIIKANDPNTISDQLELLADTILNLDPKYQNRLQHYIKVKQKALDPTAQFS